MSRYELASLVTNEQAAALAQYDPLLQQLLVNRGVVDAVSAASFLMPAYDAGLHDPFQLPNMADAVQRIEAALSSQEHIAVFADYDCDGIPAAVVFSDFFTAIGHDLLRIYIPHRHYEGFGLSERAVDTLADEGVTLIITADCGTSNIAAVARARERGVDVIITDHHEPGTVLPNALAIVNPKLPNSSYPFSGLCGAGVVYKVVQALLAHGQYDLIPGYEKWWLDMVGVATIADMVPLVDENRVLAHFGLQVLRKSRRPGLQQLLRAARIPQRFLTEDDIGFTIGPRLNAASRMDTPEDAFQMLVAQADAEAGAYATHLEHLNNERKGLVAAMTKELHKRIELLDELPPVLVFGNPSWRPALAGLAAGKLAEEYNRPAFIWGRDGNGIIKGSCRGGGSCSVHALMEATADMFLEWGGHHASGGFSVQDDAIHTLADRLNQAFNEHAVIIEPSIRTIDADLTLSDVPRVLALMKDMQPFGMGNEKPLFRFRAVVPTAVTQFGKTKEHLKVQFNNPELAIEAIAFFASADSFTSTPHEHAALDLIAHIEESFFMGRKQVRLRIVDII